MASESESKIYIYGALGIGIAILLLLLRGNGNAFETAPSALPKTQLTFPGITTRPIRLPTGAPSSDGAGNYTPVEYTSPDGGITPGCNCGDYKFEFNFSTVAEQSEYFYADRQVRPLIELPIEKGPEPLPRQAYGRGKEWSQWGFFESINIPSRMF
jgi:hypothetical protein